MLSFFLMSVPRLTSCTKTLDAFLREAGLPPDAGNTQKGDITVEKILEEKKVFDLSVSFEKLGDGPNKWTLPGQDSLPILLVCR